ncbi:MAG: FixH family protein [Planctomycetota bacterium]
MTSASPTDQTARTQAASKRRWHLMPMVVLGLLGAHMAFIFTAITLGTGDPSFAVVPDYYQKAVGYDAYKALLAESESLGWSVQLSPAGHADAIGQREMIVHLRDGAGDPVQGLRVLIDGFHQARASQPVSFECVEALPGQYVGKAPLAREGFWRFAIDASGGDQRFVAELKQFVSAAEVLR